MTQKFRACIIGLGQVGLKFDLEAERRANPEDVWTHFTAYERLADQYQLVAAVDPDPSTWEHARKRNPEIACFPSIAALVESRLSYDVVSVCTPDRFHLSHTRECLGQAKAVFLEKPVSLLEETGDAQSLARDLKEARVAARVNYAKREEPATRRLIESIRANGEKIAWLECKYTGPFITMGCHALDLLNYIAPVKTVKAVERHEAEEGDGFSAMLLTESGALANLLYAGKRHDFIFELDLVTDRARYQLTHNLTEYRRSVLSASSRYKGYREYFASEEERYVSNPRRFVGYLDDLAQDLRAGKPDYTNLTRAIETQVLMQQIGKSR